MGLLSEPLRRGTGKPSAALVALVTTAATLAMHIIVPALPATASDLGVSPAEIQLTITVYLVGLAVGQLLYGSLSDRFGRRPLLLMGLTLYVAGSVFSMVAAGLEALLVARVVQAIGGCGGLVLGRAMVRDGSTPEDAAGRLALLTMAMTVAPAISPAIGGLIAGWVGWRAVHLALALFGTLLALWVLIGMPESNRNRLQAPGFAVLVTGYWHLLRLPKFRNFAIGGSCSTVSIYAFLSVSPFIFVDILDRPLNEVGFYYLVIVAGATLGAVAARKISFRVEARRGAQIGNAVSLLSALAFLMIGLTGQLSLVAVVGSMTVYSFGVGIASPHAMAGSMSIEPRLIGAASSLYGFAQMALGALLTLIVSIWHDDTIMPVAIVLLTTSAIGQVAFQRIRRG